MTAPARGRTDGNSATRPRPRRARGAGEGGPGGPGSPASRDPGHGRPTPEFPETYLLSGSVVLSSGAEVFLRVVLRLPVDPVLGRADRREVEDLRIPLHDLAPSRLGPADPRTRAADLLFEARARRPRLGGAGA